MHIFFNSKLFPLDICSRINSVSILLTHYFLSTRTTRNYTIQNYITVFAMCHFSTNCGDSILMKICIFNESVIFQDL